MIDLHMHSNFSPDSKERLITYFEYSNEPVIVTTEHLDYMQTGSDHSIPDYHQQVKEISQVSKLTGKTGLVGIEVGYTVESADLINDYLSDKQFDFKILSIHQDQASDYLYKEPGYVVDSDYYLETIIDGLNNIPEINSLGHLDYPFRNNEHDPQFFNNQKLINIFETLITNYIALEVNTRSLYQFSNLDFYEQLLKLYAIHGGQLIALASDAHSTSYYQYEFAQAIEFIDQLGQFEYLNHQY